MLPLLATLAPAEPSRRAGAAAALAAVPRDSRLGIAHVAYADGTTPGDIEARYNRAAEAGATWDRWVIYWTDVERSAGTFDFSRVDATLARDQAHGFQVDAILLGTPSFYATGGSAVVATPRVGDRAAADAYLQARSQGLAVEASTASSAPSNLYQPTFADGTDVTAPGKPINPNNYWARFVNTTVARYQGKVGVWEIWNEQDSAFFWSGTLPDYVRLLKVGYLAARAADPAAKIAVGGQMYWEWVNRDGVQQAWLKQFVAAVKQDAAAATSGYYFDVLPYHFYSRASDVYWRTVEGGKVLTDNGIAGKEVWVNESNAPACGEPPKHPSCGVTNDPFQVDYKGGATVEEQAAFVIQATAYALAAGLGQYFVFQYADDGVGEAFGLFRGDGGSGSARPAYTAYQVAAQYLGGATSASRAAVGDYERITVHTQRGGAPQTATVVWKRTPGDGTLYLPGTGEATLVDQDGTTQAIAASGGNFAIALRGATNNRNFGTDPNDYIIGGLPRILLTNSAPAPAESSGLLANGGFELGGDCPTGPTSWGCQGLTPARLSSSALRGARALLLGSGFVPDPYVPGDPQGSNSTVYQPVTLPGAGSPFLRLAYRLDTQESAPDDAGDWHAWPDRLEVVVVDAGNVAHYPLVTRVPTGWRTRRIDLSPYRGQMVTIYFNVYQSSADRPTTALIDDVAVWGSDALLPLIRR